MAVACMLAQKFLVIFSGVSGSGWFSNSMIVWYWAMWSKSGLLPLRQSLSSLQSALMTSNRLPVFVIVACSRPMNATVGCQDRVHLAVADWVGKMQGDVADPCVCSAGRTREESPTEKGYSDAGDVRCHHGAAC